MFLKTFVIGVVLSVWPYVVKCQDDASVESRESNLSQTGTGFEPRRFVDDGIDDVKAMLDNRNMAATDYQNFPIDEHRLARDIDSVESNVNVNVNGFSPSRLPWNEPRSWRPNRRPESKKFGRNGGNGLNRIMRLLHQMPNSNIDYTFAHPDGHVRVQRRRNSRRKFFQRDMPSENNEESTRTGSTGNQCQPIVSQALQYLRLIKKNLRNWENDLMSFVGNADYELL